MNRHTRHTLARFLRLGVMSCVLLCCLIALQTPALAVAIYDAVESGNGTVARTLVLVVSAAALVILTLANRLSHSRI